MPGGMQGVKENATRSPDQHTMQTHAEKKIKERKKMAEIREERSNPFYQI